MIRPSAIMRARPLAVRLVLDFDDYQFEDSGRAIPDLEDLAGTVGNWKLTYQTILNTDHSRHLAVEFEFEEATAADRFVEALG